MASSSSVGASRASGGVGTARAIRTIGACASVVAISALAASLGGCTHAPRLQGPAPVVELRMAEFEATEGFQEQKSREGETIWVAPGAAVDLDDFSTALIRRQGADDFLLLNVKTGSRIRLDAVTMEHLDRPVAFMIDGQVVYVPTLKTSISRQVPVRVGARGITLEEAHRIMDAIADRRDAATPISSVLFPPKPHASSAPPAAPDAAPAPTSTTAPEYPPPAPPPARHP